MGQNNGKDITSQETKNILISGVSESRAKNIAEITIPTDLPWESSPGIIKGVHDDKETSHRQITIICIGAGKNIIFFKLLTSLALYLSAVDYFRKAFLPRYCRGF